MNHFGNFFAKILRRFSLALVFFSTTIFSSAGLAAIGKATNDSSQPSLPAVLKADKVDGNRITNVINATGNVELKKDNNILFSNELTYNKDLEQIYANGNVRIKNYDLGNVFAQSADMKSDFTQGNFNDATIVFNDGSYIKSPKITRLSKEKTLFNRSIFSICPNKDIENDNLSAGKNADAISIKSTTTLIDKEDGAVKTKNGVIRVYDVPLLYTPYLSMPLPSSGRKSGFLHPSYIVTTNLGRGVRIPYYFNIAPDKDLTTTLQIHPFDKHLILDNNYRQLLKQGAYNVDIELANNKPKSNGIVGTATKDSNQSTRWYGKSQGDFILSKTVGLEFNIDNVGDKNYLRDYHNSFDDHTLSTVNLNYIKDKDYASVQMVKVQELGVDQDEKTAPTALPVINYYTESKPKAGMFNQTYSLLANTTVISRDSGLQYRRASLKPQITIPYNVSGNLFEASANVQGDFYNMENNFTTTPRDNNFDRTAANYRPEASLKWSLPLVNKLSKNTIIIEPLAVMAISSYKNNFNKIPNEDTNNAELTQGNLFLTDRLVGFDRNESGKRISYGFKSSLFNDDLGQFGLSLGQSFKKNEKTQDVVIKGFNDSDKSNIVGGVSYKSPKIFSVIYNFQLNESNYRNDINEVITTLNFERVQFSSSYLFIRRTFNNDNKIEQFNLGSTFKITKKLSFVVGANHDMVLGRTISKSYGLNYDGCCVTSGIAITENNVSALVKPEKSYKINFVIKNL